MVYSYNRPSSTIEDIPQVREKSSCSSRPSSTTEGILEVSDASSWSRNSLFRKQAFHDCWRPSRCLWYFQSFQQAFQYYWKPSRGLWSFQLIQKLFVPARDLPELLLLLLETSQGCMRLPVVFKKLFVPATDLSVLLLETFQGCMPNSCVLVNFWDVVMTGTNLFCGHRWARRGGGRPRLRVK